MARDLRENGTLRTALQLGVADADPALIRWIVDTSIECDHQRFSGVLKVSLEEILIALRDDAALLKDPANLFLSDPTRAAGEEEPRAERATLYPDGFSARRFVEVFERAAI